VDATSTVVWLAPDPPDAGQRRALGTWAALRDVRVSQPLELPVATLAVGAVDPHVADAVEDLLERARDAMAAVDGASVDAHLATADALLRAHPEQPQAAWLMAEVERARAARWRRIAPTDSEAAERAWMRAEALDGGRQPGIGEQAAASRAPDASLELVAPGSDAGQTWLDGRPVGARAETRAGLHALVVTWAGSPVWAEWKEAPAGASRMDLDAPRPAPCTTEDLAGVRLEREPRERIVVPDSVRCARWIAVAPGGHPQEVRVAACEAGRCGPLVDWRMPEPWAAPTPARSTDASSRARWPAWATWSAVGAGAAIATGAAVVLVTALRTPAAETRFAIGGIRAQ
jgi:hypothetical protein